MALRAVTIAAVILPLTGVLGSCQRPAGPAPKTGQVGVYPPVTKDDLRGKEFRVGNPTGSFTWSFTDDGFVMRGRLPKDVLDTLLGPGGVAQSVTGKWNLADGQLSLTELAADCKAAPKQPVLPVYRTGPIRVQFGESQYVFGWALPDK
jgi:hypothetical protein